VEVVFVRPLCEVEGLSVACGAEVRQERRRISLASHASNATCLLFNSLEEGDKSSARAAATVASVCK
jgi:hypothetical protein